MITRRRWLSLAAGSGALAATRALAQDAPSAGVADTSNLFPMDQSAARSVRRPPKPNARPVVTPAERDALEHRIRCQCGCTLDVYTCRTTDFTCRVSPQMHRDVLALVEGGYDADEILASFVDVYGERVLMAPPKEGFNLLAWVLPGLALAIGAMVLAAILWRWRRAPAVAGTGASAPAAAAAPLDATPDEIAALEEAIRNDR